MEETAFFFDSAEIPVFGGETTAGKGLVSKEIGVWVNAAAMVLVAVRAGVRVLTNEAEEADDLNSFGLPTEILIPFGETLAFEYPADLGAKMEVGELFFPPIGVALP